MHVTQGGTNTLYIAAERKFRDLLFEALRGNF